jgi:hypothetical protein
MKIPSIGTYLLVASSGEMEGISEPVALLLAFVLWLLWRVMRVEAFWLGLIESCGGHCFALVWWGYTNK